jgi:hypothetical protein
VIRAAILEVTERTRRAQLEVLKARWEHYEHVGLGLSPEALLFILNGIPKMAQLEEAFGVETAHDEVLHFVQERLKEVEPGGSRFEPRVVPAQRPAGKRKRLPRP